MVAGSSSLSLPMGRLAHVEVMGYTPTILHRSAYEWVRSLSPENGSVGTTTEHWPRTGTILSVNSGRRAEVYALVVNTTLVALTGPRAVSTVQLPLPDGRTDSTGVFVWRFKENLLMQRQRREVTNLYGQKEPAGCTATAWACTHRVRRFASRGSEIHSITPSTSPPSAANSWSAA